MAPQKRPERRRWRRPKRRGDLEALFLEHLPRLERVAAAAGRRVGLLPQDVEDFVSRVELKVIDRDYAVLRKHRGDSKLSTYLTTVVHNQLKDFLNHKWGKFRPSAAARRLGRTALRLERLLVLDQHDLEPAIEILKGDPKVKDSRDALRRIAEQLPERTTRHFVGEETLERQVSDAPEADAERRVANGERQATAERVESALEAALETLSAQDLLILKMFYRDGCTVAAIATALRLAPRPLYSRKEKCLARLRSVFDAEGLTWDEVREILGWQGREVRADFGAGAGEETETRPSKSSSRHEMEEEP